MNDDLALKWIAAHTPFYIQYVDLCYNYDPEAEFPYLYLVPAKTSGVSPVAEDVLLRTLVPQFAAEFLILESSADINDPSLGAPISLSTAHCNWKPTLVQGDNFPIVDMFAFINTHAPNDLHFLAKGVDLIIIFTHHGYFKILGTKNLIELFRVGLTGLGAMEHPEDYHRFEVSFKSGVALDP